MTDAVVMTKALARSYRVGDRTVEALAGVDVTVRRGEFVAFAGVSGSGKSTLMHLIGGLDRPSSGEVWVDGVELGAAGDAERTLHRRQRVGFVFQSFNLLPRLTAVENVALPLMFAGVGRAEREQRAQSILEELGLGQRLRHYPNQLSGGEQQRVAIARALIHNPAVVLADEPTGNLDSKTGSEILALLRQLNRERGVTVLMVTHDAEAAALADRIIRLRDGRIERIEEGQRAAAPAVAMPPPPLDATSRRPPGLRFGDLVRSALANLSRRVVRSSLTVLGVFIGTITIVTMLSVAVGVQLEVRRNVEAVGLDTVYVMPPQVQTSGIDPYADPLPATPITPASVAALSRLPQVASVSPVVNLPAYLDLRIQRGDQAVLVQQSGRMTRLNPLAEHGGDRRRARPGRGRPAWDCAVVAPGRRARRRQRARPGRAAADADRAPATRRDQGIPGDGGGR